MSFRRRPFGLGALAVALAAATINVANGQTISQAKPLPGPHATMSTACLLTNAFTRCLVDRKLTIVVIGNSVSYGAAYDGDKIDSYYVYLADWFRKTFPAADIQVKLGIIFAIGPEVQLFRMDDKVLRPHPDLVVTEFGAANGAWGEKGREITERATEGYIRRLRMLRPETDILMNLSIFTSMMEIYRQEQVPPTVAFQEKVAKHYECALTDSGAAIAERILAGEPWATFMKDGIHPGPKGYAVHGEVIGAELDRQYRLYQALPAAARAVKTHTVPVTTVHRDPWVTPRLVPAAAAQVTGFTAGENGRVRLVEANTAGASGCFAPAKGRIIGLLYQVPDAPVKSVRAELEVQADGAGEWKRLSLKSEPCFPEEDDRANRFQRHFFAVYGLPLYSRRIDFRVVHDPAAKGAVQPVRIAGFFVVD